MITVCPYMNAIILLLLLTKGIQLFWIILLLLLLSMWLALFIVRWGKWCLTSIFSPTWHLQVTLTISMRIFLISIIEPTIWSTSEYHLFQLFLILLSTIFIFLLTFIYDTWNICVFLLGNLIRSADSSHFRSVPCKHKWMTIFRAPLHDRNI